MTTQKDRIEAAIRHIQTSADIDPWAMELAVDALKAQGTCEDAVSRQTLQKELALYPIDDITSEDEAGYNRAINDVQKMVLHLPSAQPVVKDTNVPNNDDIISRHAVIDRAVTIPMFGRDVKMVAVSEIKNLPSAQPERTCVNCGRTVNNGGWYADGGTRCPIEEHYALPKDGYCHLWEKRNVTDDDYPERRTYERPYRQTGGD